MKKKGYLFVVVILLICIVAPVWGAGRKEELRYPTRTISAIIGFSAGGPTDIIGRGILPILQEKIGVGIGITNMPGASGSVAARHVLDQPADGYTLYMGSEIMSIWQTMGTADLSPITDFIPIKLVSQAIPVIAVPPGSKFRTAEEFLAYARENPGELRVATAGPGTVPHVSGLLVSQVVGTRFTFVPFAGGAPAIVATMGGQVDATMEMVQGMIAHHRGGKLRILASFTNVPVEGLGVPALGAIEPRLQPFLPYGPYFGLYAPRGTPPEIVKFLEEKMTEAIKDPRWIEHTNRLHLPRISYSGDEAMNFIQNWRSRATWLLHDLGGAPNSPEKFGIPRPR